MDLNPCTSNFLLLMLVFFPVNSCLLKVIMCWNGILCGYFFMVNLCLLDEQDR